MFAIFTAGLACLAPFAAAYTTPTGDAPKGNAIYTPGMNSVVSAGKDYTITWNPTTEGTISVVLLKGPGNDAVPQYAIVEKIKNSGSYTWTVKEDLEPTDGASGYGIELIDDATGQYQYSTQFGIDNPDYEVSAPSSTSAMESGHGHVSATSDDWSSASAIVSSSSWSSSVTSSASLAVSTSEAVSSVAVSSSWYSAGNSSSVQTSAPSSLVTHTTAIITTSTSRGAKPTESGPTVNAAGNVATSFAGLVIAAGVAVLAI
nr:hypothetical protein CFP56_52764 [Quercus suber]